MKNNIFLKAGLLLASTLAAATILFACGGGSEPENRELELSIKEGKLDLDPPVVKVKQDDSVTLRVDADEPGTFHLHGYDKEFRVRPGETATVVFDADATGSFVMTFHHGDGGDQGDHESRAAIDVETRGALFESPTLEKGGGFSFDVPLELDGLTVPYHNHFDHEMKGTILVSSTAALSSRVSIEVNGDSFQPAEVTVRPGTRLVWTIVGEARVQVASGLQSTADDDHELED